jgi:biofilm PGA synthesis N-glycosyltransferase PgaC
VDLLARFLQGFQHTTVYMAMLFFFGFYPIFSAIVWLTTSLVYFIRKEKLSESREAELYALPDPPPLVSILIPTHCEEKVVEATIEGALGIDYPNHEVIVIDDGSTDATLSKIAPYVASGRVRLVRKTVNEGKAMALNDGLFCANGEIVLTIDADAVVDPQILNYVVPHFSSSRVGAVTGNPRVSNRRTLLSKLQFIEFTSIVGLLRRAQRVWGRIQTVSGVVVAFRRKALFDVGLFDPSMATEDIDVSWRLQKRFWDIRYEPKGIVHMQVPETLKNFFKQRRRWAIGLGQVLRSHIGILVRRKNMRQWPVAYEAIFSTLWAVCFVILTGIWTLSYSLGIPPVGAHPIPNFWGMLIAATCLLQLSAGILLDGRYDRSVVPFAVYTVLYPLVYWILTSTLAFLYTPVGLFRKRPAVTLWKTERI